MSRKDRNKRNVNNKGPNALWLLVILLAAGMGYLFWYNSVNKEITSINYTTLVKALEENQINSLAIQDQHVQGKFKDGRMFDSHVLLNQRFVDLLLSRAVDVEVFPKDKQQWGTYLLFMILLFSLLPLFIYFKHSQGSGPGGGKIFNVGKSKARFFSPNSITITFKDVAGVTEAKDDLQDIIEFLKNPERFERIGAKIPRGILLSGDPGNGKTLLAKAVAGEASCPFFSISGSDFVEVFVGVGASRVRDLFAQARRHAPCIVFIDEIDAVGRQRGVGLGGGNDEREQTLNQLLSEMDGFSTEHGSVIVLAATNRQDVLDKALLRPGRFDRTIPVPYPDLSARREILGVHSRGVKLSSTVDLDRIAQGTVGFSGANLEWLINEAALLASKKHATEVSMEHFELSRDKIIVGPERKTLIFTDKEKMITSYHEGGHSLINMLVPDTDPFHKVTIIPRGPALGISWSLQERDPVSKTREQLEADIMVCMGGLLAEKIVYSLQTVGPSSDLQSATATAQSMVFRYGMSDLGPIVFNSNNHSPYGRPEYSEKTAEKLDEEVSKILKNCMNRAEKLLIENRDKLDLLSKTLYEKETLHAAEAYELLNIPPRESFSLKDHVKTTEEKDPKKDL